MMKRFIVIMLLFAVAVTTPVSFASNGTPTTEVSENHIETMDVIVVDQASEHNVYLFYELGQEVYTPLLNSETTITSRSTVNLKSTPTACASVDFSRYGDSINYVNINTLNNDCKSRTPTNDIYKLHPKKWVWDLG